jgi:hypothetical protein
MIACQLGDSQIVKRLLEEATVDVNAIDNVRPITFVKLRLGNVWRISVKSSH